MQNNKHLYLIYCVLLVIGNIAAQIYLHQEGLDNQTVNDYSPARDARDYVKRAELIAIDGDFKSAFEDGWRLPAYPLFLSLFYFFSDTPLLVARYTQIILSALTILCMYLTFVNITGSEFKGALGATIIALWVPFYFFSTILKAESLNIFLFALFLFILSSVTRHKNLIALYSLPLLLAMLVYLKPNHALILIPLVTFLLLKRNIIETKHIVGIVAVFILLLVPWTVYISSVNNTLIPLSTTAGRNLYLGSGVATDQHYEAGALHFIISDRFELRDNNVTTKTLTDIETMTKAQQSDYYTEIAKQVWISRPGKTFVFAVSKILHAFGFSLRDIRDFVFAALFLFSLGIATYLWIKNYYREWCAFFFGIVLIFALQTFFFTIEQRYRIVIFDIPAMIVSIIGFLKLMERLASQRSDNFSNLFKQTDFVQ